MEANRIIKITEIQSDQRIDKFLAEQYPGKSRVFWKNRIENGCVFVNGKTAKPTYKLKTGNEISIAPEIESETSPAAKQKYETPKINIIYEDSNVVVLDKPAGIPVHEASSYKGATVVDFLVEHFPGIKDIGEDKTRPGIVHRLDKDTSGVLISAKNNDAFQFLKNQFKNRLVQKTYTALVYGSVPDDHGAIDLSIGRSRSNPKMQTAIDSKKKTDIKAREALTIYNVKKRFKDYTLLEAIPKTGRMHQIRVHLKALGFPIAGDKKYFSKKYAKIEPKPERQFLHAGKLEIELPALGKKTFTSEIPEDLAEFLDKIS
ncbi:MAG: RluA family pseudouridine synthase [Candidatus Paceibacterota bacterium]|jgi:23S rRNA pseudouridine1911/1915/1917 synthase